MARAIAIPYEPQRRNPFGIIILAIIAAVILYAAVQLTFHALLNHGQDAEDVRRCINQNGPELTGWNGDRKFEVCFIEPFKYGIHITVKNGDGTWNEITSFIFRKQKGATLDRVIEYLARTGVVFK